MKRSFNISWHVRIAVTIGVVGFASTLLLVAQDETPPAQPESRRSVRTTQMPVKFERLQVETAKYDGKPDEEFVAESKVCLLYTSDAADE